MKRDFEREFKELKMSEVPDLWNRIEAGLSDKKIVSPVSDAAAISVNRYNFGKRAVWRKWGTLAAACVCVALIIPAISVVIGNLGGRKSNYSGASFAPTADNGADSSMNENTENMTASSEMAADDDMADAAEMMLGESMEAESDMAFNEGVAGAADMAPNENKTAAADIMADAESANRDNSTNMTQASEKESASAATNGESASKEDSLKKQASEADVTDENENFAMSDEAIYVGLENGQVLDGVVIEVAEASISGEEVIYSIVIKQPDEDGLLNAGAELSIVCNSDTSYGFIHKVSEKKALKVGESYEVSLRYEKSSGSQSSGTYSNGRFVVVSAKKN
ncbi:MAG: hypothetical protein HDR03_03945 [Lachnospiraceae bacterium]|nr:hypothetical protein [Lachnospiraceae bacterium]